MTFQLHEQEGPSVATASVPLPHCELDASYSPQECNVKPESPLQNWATHECAKLHGLNLAIDKEIDDYAKAVQSCSSFTGASARSDGSAKNEVGSNLHAWHDSRISVVFGSTIIQYTRCFGAE